MGFAAGCRSAGIILNAMKSTQPLCSSYMRVQKLLKARVHESAGHRNWQKIARLLGERLHNDCANNLSLLGSQELCG